MKEIFIKKYWDEGDILFYLHFKDGVSVRQIEISPTGTKYLSAENPIQGESILYDKELEHLELEPSDFITKEEFDNVWKAN